MDSTTNPAPETAPDAVPGTPAPVAPAAPAPRRLLGGSYLVQPDGQVQLKAYTADEPAAAAPTAHRQE